MTLIYINHTLPFFTCSRINTNTHPHTATHAKFIDFFCDDVHGSRFHFVKAVPNTHISVIPGRDTLTQAANTEFRTATVAATPASSETKDNMFHILQTSHYTFTRRQPCLAYVIETHAQMHGELYMWKEAGETGGKTENETKRGREKQILQSLCLLLASGFYGRGKVENLREIDEYPWHAGTHALTQSTHTFLFIFVGVSLSLHSTPILSYPLPLYSPLLSLYSPPLLLFPCLPIQCCD